MPLFEFTCPSCGETIEVLSRTVDDTPAPECPACGSETTRQWSPVAAVGRSTARCTAPGSGFT